MTFHWVSNTPPPPYTHTHSETEQMHCLKICPRYLLCLDIGQTFLWMKRRSINYKIKIHVAMHGYCTNTPFDWKGKHLPLIRWIEWLCSLHINVCNPLWRSTTHLSVVMILQAVEKNQINIKLYWPIPASRLWPKKVENFTFERLQLLVQTCYQQVFDW